MTLASGTKLGSYEIVAPLGAGGMGEVYRARDTRPGRDNRDLQAAKHFRGTGRRRRPHRRHRPDSYGVLAHSIRAAMRQKDDADLTPVEWQSQYFAYRKQITPSAYAELKSRLERAVERDGRQPPDTSKRHATVTTRADRAPSGADSGRVRAEEGLWVAVLLRGDARFGGLLRRLGLPPA